MVLVACTILSVKSTASVMRGLAKGLSPVSKMVFEHEARKMYASEA